METSTHSVIVFDDPVSSFDYNYINNYCNRLRDYVTANVDPQIIIFTHNWEFFVQLQRTLNQSRLNHSLSVQVIENCCSAAEYSEKVDALDQSITAILNKPVEPSRKQKEELASNMRRLIEAIVNTHVFNNQRHQFKQKSQSVSDFQEFTKIVPLEQQEATILRDLYSKLSMPEHDDPRNSYMNSDKSMFQTRYQQIKSVENGIVSRK